METIVLLNRYPRMLLIVIALLAATVLQASPDTISSAEIDARLKRGEEVRGYALTVFNGTRIDTFQLDVLAVLRKYDVKADAIIIRARGDLLKPTGIAQGMSGSPVFIDGRLAGAVSWGRSFTKGPLAGVTPIAQMLRIPDRSMTPPPATSQTWAPGTVIDRAFLLSVDSARTLRAIRLPPEWSDAPGLSAYAGTELRPLAMPLSITGLTPRTREIARKILGDLNIQVVQGGSAGAAEDLAGADLVPGASLGVTLADGDFAAAGTGTVTWRDGETVIGFGHPMFFSGNVNFPMSLAYVHFLWPSQIISHKVASPGPIVGALRQDRAYGVAGVMGEIPSMIPVHVSIKGGTAPHDINYRVTRDKMWGPRMAVIGLLSSLGSLEILGGPASLEMTQTIEIERGDSISRIERKNFITDFNGLYLAAREAMGPLQALAMNPFEPVTIKKISFSVEFRERIEATFITGLDIPRRVVRPGDPVIVNVLMKDYLGKEHVVATKIPTDKDMREGIYELRVGDGPSAERWEHQRTPGRFMPMNLDQLIRALNFQKRNDGLSFEIVDKSLGMTIDDQVLPDLPNTEFEMLRFALPAGRVIPVFSEPVARLHKNLGRYVIGERRITVALYRHARPR
jgi:hypothetical protein